MFAKDVVNTVSKIIDIISKMPEEYEKYKEDKIDMEKRIDDQRKRYDEYKIDIDGNKVTVNDSFTYTVLHAYDSEYLEYALRTARENDFQNEIPPNTESEWAVVINDHDSGGVYLDMYFFDTKEEMLECIQPDYLPTYDCYPALMFHRGVEVEFENTTVINVPD